ncbi:MAG: EMC3/TMCO1 family protein [archaeon]
MEPAIIIFCITVALAALSKVLQRKLIDKEKMKAFQTKIKEDQKKFNELLKEADKNKKEIEELQSRIMQQNMEMMNSNMKLSLFTMPAFLIAFWFLGTLYGGQLLVSIIPLPTFNNFFLLNPLSWIPVGLGMTAGYYKIYFFYYLIAAILMNYIDKGYDKFIKKK